RAVLRIRPRNRSLRRCGPDRILPEQPGARERVRMADGDRWTDGRALRAVVPSLHAALDRHPSAVGSHCDPNTSSGFEPVEIRQRRAEMTSRLVALCFDANDPRRLARFWAAALQWNIDVETDDGV